MAVSKGCQPMGDTEAANLFGVTRVCIRQWVAQGKLPEPDFMVNGRRAWNRSTLERWAKQTDREVVG